jgi:UbiD family decarboxylase
MGSFINTKLVIAVDPDIDMYDYREVMYAVATRVDPVNDLIVIPNTRGWIFDPRATPEVDATPNTAQSRFPSTAARWGINATKPPRYKAERKDYERAMPIGYGTVRLDDYR